MLKRTNRLAILIAAIATVVTTVSFGYFCFEKITSVTKPVIQDLRVDSIYENYESIRAKAGDGANITDVNYTIYVFPSADYLDIYKEYLKNPATNKKPEEIFGYLSPQMLESGEVKRKPNGVIDYKMHELNSGKKGYLDRMASYRSSNGTLNAYSISTEDNRTTLQSIYGKYENAYKRKYGVPAEFGTNGKDKYVLPQSTFQDLLDHKGSWGRPDPLIDSYRALGNKQLFEYDRFGYWEELTYEEGRFMPVKIDFVNSVSPYVFSDSIGKINMSMPDGNPRPWFDHSFSGFTYALPPTNSQKDSGLPLYDIKNGLPHSGMIHGRDLFNGYDLNKIFDISSDISKYCDENNVIRLFPTFSNGKGYHSSKSSSIYGGKDAVKMTVTTNNKSSVYVPQYVSTVGKTVPTFTQGGKKGNLYLTTLLNVDIEKDTNLRVSMHVANGNGDWGGQGCTNWADTPTTDRHDWINNVYDITFDANSITTKLNGSGKYNIFLFIGNSGHALHNHWKDSVGGYVAAPTIDHLFDRRTAGEKYDDDSHFPFLRGKRMFSFPKLGNDNKTVVHYADAMNVANDGKGTYNGHWEGGYYSADVDNRPVYMLMQKSTLPKIYSNLNATEISNQSFEQHILDNFNYADTGFNFSQPLYKEISGGTPERVYRKKNSQGQFIDDNIDNLFMYHGLNLVDTNYDYLQFRFGDVYNSKISFNLSPSIKKLYYNVNPDDITAGKVSPKNIFTPADEFFELITPEASPQNEFLFKIKNPKNDRGIYDVILALSEADINTNTVKFDVYLYRHRNIFIKLFSNNKFNTYIPDALANNPTAFTDHNNIDSNVNSHMWEGQYYIGQSISSEDRHIDIQKGGSVAETNGIIEQNTLGEAIDKFVADSIATGGEFDYDRTIVRDYITDAPIGWYLPIVAEPNCIERSHYKLVFNSSFKVLKNYIFYFSLFDGTMVIPGKEVTG